MEWNLKPALKKKLESVKRHVRGGWEEPLNRDNPWKLYYGPNHCRQVEKVLTKLIADTTEIFSTEHLFWLRCSVWLYSTGMLRDNDGEPFSMLTSGHNQRRDKYIQAWASSIELETDDVLAIRAICDYVSNYGDKPKDDVHILLGSLLIIADAFHYDENIETQSKDILIVGLNQREQFHWLKGVFGRGQSFDRQTPTCFNFEVDPKLDSFTTQFFPDKPGELRNFLRDKLNERLFLAREELLENGFFKVLKTDVVDADSRSSRTIDSQAASQKGIQLLSDLILRRIASASELSKSVTDILIHLADEEDADTFIGTFYKNVLVKLTEDRPCHIILQKIRERVEIVVQENDHAEVDEAIRILKRNLIQFQADRSKYVALLHENAQPLLRDGGSVLVFGYSKLILDSLNKLSDEKKETIAIYVCLCYAKTDYNSRNEVEYMDGIEYSRQLEENGFKNVELIPDSAVANYMFRRKIQKVLFGANGVDSDGGEFGHTAGHLFIALLAWHYKIPVYVFADSFKFGVLNPQTEMERTTEWLPKEQKERVKGKVRMRNPREDIVSMKDAFEEGTRLYYLITDTGVFPHYQIPLSINERGKIMDSK